MFSVSDGPSLLLIAMIFSPRPSCLTTAFFLFVLACACPLDNLLNCVEVTNQNIWGHKTFFNFVFLILDNFRAKVFEWSLRLKLWYIYIFLIFLFAYSLGVKAQACSSLVLIVKWKLHWIHFINLGKVLPKSPNNEYLGPD